MSEYAASCFVQAMIYQLLYCQDKFVVSYALLIAQFLVMENNGPGR